jgi:rubrerythrin
MDDNALTRLTADQLARLNDEQKAIFCTLVLADQEFFAQTFKPTDLPTALTRKGEILQRSQVEREKMQKLQQFFANSVEAHPAKNDDVEGMLLGAAGVLGIGAAAVVAVTDNTAHYTGVKPEELIPPLRAEFSGDRTAIDFSGRPEALIATVSLLTNSGAVPALTINLTSVENGLDVKVNDLTTHGILETVKQSGKKLLNVAGNALELLNRSKQGASPQELFERAGETLAQGTDLAEAAGGLKLKERAWKAIKQAAESIEANALSRLQEERAARTALELAWDKYYNCPTCGVSFAPEEIVCRVCGTARPEPPAKPDPRKI